MKPNRVWNSRAYLEHTTNFAATEQQFSHDETFILQSKGSNKNTDEEFR